MLNKKTVIYGVNSTFSTQNINSPLSSPEKNMPMLKLSTSLNENIERIRCLERADSSDSGGATFYKSSSQQQSERGSSFAPFHADTFDVDVERGDGEFYVEKESSPLKKKKSPSKLIHIVKDLTMHERTAARDLELMTKLLTVNLHPWIEECRVLKDLLGFLNSIHALQKTFLHDLEIRLQKWDDIDDASDIPELLLCTAHNTIPQYKQLIDQFPIYIGALDELDKSKPSFHEEFTSATLSSCQKELYLSRFESSDECYISVNWILLRILNRIVGWQPILARLVEFCLEEGEARAECELSGSRVALDKISAFAADTLTQREALASYATLLQREKDLNVLGALTHPNRKLLREGWIERWSRKGLSPRVALLFNDVLLFAHRTPSTPGGFALHAQMPLKGMLFEEGDAYGVCDPKACCLTVYAGEKSVVLAAPDAAARQIWLDELREAVKAAARSRLTLPPVKFDAVTGGENERESMSLSRSKTAETETSKNNLSTLHVCWHRQSTIGALDLMKAVTNQKSGYLLRKLRNSTGWQKLWVVLTNFTMFFYKSHEDSAPLANLPLLEYVAGVPSIDDHISHPHVFKLSYGTHFYFFRADSHYAFLRWVECIRMATLSRTPVDALTALALRI